MDTTPKSNISRRHKPLFLLIGVVFECLLIALRFLLPEGSWLSIKAFNFLILTHYLALLLIDALGLRSNGEESFGLALVFIGMSVIWACLFYLIRKLMLFLVAHFGISRRQKLLIGCGVSSLCPVLFLWPIIDDINDRPTPFHTSSAVKTLVTDNTAFAVALYQNQRQRPGNIFFSPFSISSGFAMVYAGARGQTQLEMAKTLHFSMGYSDLNPSFSGLILRTERIQHWNRVALLSANSLWCQKYYSYTPEFENTLRANYRTELHAVNFKIAAPAAAGEINSWVAKKTQGKIKDILAPDQLSSDTRLVLCNTIYFKAKWAHQFALDHTKPAPFHIATNETVMVPMMSQKSGYKAITLDDPAVGLLELPYWGRDLSMIILLPQSTFDDPPELEKLEAALNPTSLQSWLTKLDQSPEHDAWVYLPRFTAAKTILLDKMLSAMCAPSLFDSAANLSGIDGGTNLFISDAIHTASIEVNETGTEAAATTLLEGKTKGITARFIVDHPFIFLIRDNVTGSILFLGRIVNPLKQ